MANQTTPPKSSKAQQKSPAPNPDMKTASADDGLPDFSTWTPLQIGFAPYWHPEPGKKFYGELIARDERDPEFTRYLVRTLRTETCRRGPNNDDTEKGAIGEEVIVNKGDTFSISVYFSLAEEFNFHLYYADKTGNHVPILVEAEKKVRTKKGQDVWLWKVLCEPTVKKQLDGKRDDYRRFVTGTDEENRPELES